MKRNSGEIDHLYINYMGKPWKTWRSWGYYQRFIPDMPFMAWVFVAVVGCLLIGLIF